MSTVQFAKELRARIQAGEITCSVRIWKQPHVNVGGRYSLPPGEIEVLAIRGMTRKEITPELARRSGFKDVSELLKIAQHGSGEHVFLVDFAYYE